MYNREDMLSMADKDLLSEFLYVSMCRVLNTSVSCWTESVPQGVSVFVAHPETGKFEYMFTKDTKYPVKRDDMEDVMPLLEANGNVRAGGLVYYLNSCMVPVVSKHRAFPY